MRGFLLTILMGLVAPWAAARAAETVQVTVAGQPVDLQGDPQAQAELFARRFLDEPMSVIVLGRPVERSRQALGARVDVARLARWLREAADPESPMRAHGGPRLDLRVPVDVDPGAALAWLEPLKHDHDREPRDATFDVESGEIVDAREGRAVDVWATLDAMYDALVSGAEGFEVVVHRTPPRRDREDLEGADFSVTLGEFDTPYNGNDRDRTHNLRVAAAKIDGLVLLPGELFDFNAVVGERSQINGFRPATVIAGGELVDGVGGGACQIAGTLHAAAYFAGLEIVERSPHSRPSSYIKLGLDAAVAWPNVNFRFRNDKAFPILIRVFNRGGFTHAEVRGAERRHLVSFVRRIDEVTPFGEREIEDPDLPEGIRVLSQRGVPGFGLTTWRILRDVRTNQAIRTRDESSYPPTTQIWRVGTGGLPPEGYVPPEGDTHGEYRADEYLVATQGPGVDGTQHVRRAGRTGTPGWTEREGMPGVGSE